MAELLATATRGERFAGLLRDLAKPKQLLLAENVALRAQLATSRGREWSRRYLGSSRCSSIVRVAARRSEPQSLAGAH